MFHVDWVRLVLVAFGVIGLIAMASSCGDREIRTGHIHDSAVQGLEWETDTMSGITGSGGEFQYKSGETVSFTLGAITLGSAVAERDITIVDIVEGASGVTNNAVTNIARLLQTLDDDGDYDNGINIIEFDRLQATTDLTFDVDPEVFEADADVMQLVEAATGSTLLVSVEDAQNHLSATISTLGKEENRAPTADAGDDQTVSSGDLVTLVGGGSDEEGVIIDHSWAAHSDNSLTVSLTDGDGLTIGDDNVDSLSATFTAPSVTSVTTLTFILTVVDNDNAQSTDEVEITINP